MLECSDYPTSTCLYKVFALLQDKGWHNIIMMKSRHFNLNSLNSVTTHEPELGILLSLLAGFPKLESNQPFYL